MPVVTAFPPGLKNESFVRNSPEKQLNCEVTPVQFVQSPLLKARNGSDKSTIKITFSSNIPKSFCVFSVGNLEQAIDHVQLVLAIIEDK